MISSRVKDVNFGIVEGDNDILLRQMQACDYALIGVDMSCCHQTAFSPCRLHQISVLEV